MPINKRNSLEEMGDEEMMLEHPSASARPGKGLAPLVIIIIIAVIAIFIVALGLRYLPGIADPIAKASAKQWQGVFLTNGQVYFGKVKSASGKTLSLEEIYYLQVVDKPLQRTQEGEDVTGKTQQELTLIKLGNEIHGPTDAMTINRDHILLTVKLKEDSRVVQAIKQYLEDQKATK
jgi:hypothetical protein